MSFFQQTTPYNTYFYAIVATPLGDMIAIANAHALVYLGFSDSVGKKTSEQLEQLKVSQLVTEQLNVPLQSIADELKLYFASKLTRFSTPIEFSGTLFENSVWNSLMNVAYGTTNSYTDLAIAIGDKKAVRAVAQANGRNRFVIMIPCHRIISKNGSLGGYSCGLNRKMWLLEHEKNTAKKDME